MTYRNYKTGEEIGTAYEVSAPYGRRVHRAHLLEILRKNIPPEKMKTGKCLKNIEYNDGIYTLSFADGSKETANIVIGCDGIHSKVRQILGIKDDPQYSGQVVYRSLLHPSSLPEETANLLKEMTNFRGQKKHILVFPIGRDDAYRLNIVAFMSEPLSQWKSESWMSKAPVSSLKEHVSDWNPHVLNIIKALEETAEDGLMKQALYVRKPVDKWYQDGIVLLGDAVHSTLPHQGQGTCQAIESSAALALLMTNAKDGETIADIYEKFKALRKPRTDEITRTSEIAGRRASTENPDVVDPNEFSPEKIGRAWDWILDYDILKETNKILMA